MKIMEAMVMNFRGHVLDLVDSPAKKIQPRFS